MSAPTSSVSQDLRHVTGVSRKAVWAYGIVTALYLLLLLLAPREGDANFRFSAEGDWIRIPDVSVPGMTVAWVGAVVMIAVTVAAFLYIRRHRPAPLWLAVVFAVFALVGFLAWAGAGSPRDFSVVRL